MGQIVETTGSVKLENGLRGWLCRMSYEAYFKLTPFHTSGLMSQGSMTWNGDSQVIHKSGIQSSGHGLVLPNYILGTK